MAQEIDPFQDYLARYPAGGTQHLAIEIMGITPEGWIAIEQMEKTKKLGLLIDPRIRQIPRGSLSGLAPLMRSQRMKDTSAPVSMLLRRVLVKSAWAGKKKKRTMPKR